MPDPAPTPAEDPQLPGLRNREAQLTNKLKKELSPRSRAEAENFLAQVKAEIARRTAK